MKDKEAWCAAAHGVTKSWTWLSNWKTIQNKQTKNIDKYVEKLEPFCSVGGNIKWCNSYANQNGGYEMLKIELSYYPAPAFLSQKNWEQGLFKKKKILIYRVLRGLFITASFAIAKMWVTEVLWIHELIIKMWYICTLFSLKETLTCYTTCDAWGV